jgi:hypothetical protein
MTEVVGQPRQIASTAQPLLSEQALGAMHYRIVGLCFAGWSFDFYELILYSFLLALGGVSPVLVREPGRAWGR